MALKLGTTALTALYLGSTAISTAYLGSVQVYDAGGAAFDPASLFASGEQGVWYEPSTSTCFTDTGGTTPATYGDAVAYLQDKSGNGNHATQTTFDNRPTLARVPEGGRRNLLEYTEEFDSDAYWTKYGASIDNDVSGIVAPDGTQTADSITETATSGPHSIGDGTRITGAFTFSVYVKYKSKQWFRISAGTIGTCYFDLLNGERGSEAVGLTSTMTPLPANGWYRITVSGTGTSVEFFFGLADADGTLTYSGDGTSGTYIWGAQLEAASSATAYQRVVDQYDITESGVDSLDYLSFGGTDDGMSTAAIDFTGTDKMSVFAGVRKLSDSLQVIAENTPSTGSFIEIVGSPVGPAAQYSSGSRGTATGKINQFAVSAASFAAPITNVLTSTHDIFGDLSTIRINGAASGTNGIGDKGAGNFGNHELWIGIRNNLTLPFNGHLYGLIVRGATSDGTEISNTEAYLATRSGVTL